MDKETLAFLPALEISNAIAKKEISSQEVVLAALDRAERTQETLNAFITICRDKALEKAIKADS
ncbi:MAG: amidase, partial [Chloroflexota bacterium]|nr:amidase [Chloroflexota bacterium]